MSIRWRMEVASSTGSGRDYVTMNSAVASLDAFSLDRAGSCLEASFTALPSEVDVRPRDFIILQTSAGGSTWTDRWAGVIVQAGNPRSHELQSYRAVGLKQRLYEVILREPVITGGDVASMAQEVAMLAHVGVRGVSGPTEDSAAFPMTGFELGDRFPGLETMGDFLDALAASAGAFIAPAGGYTYDGTNYAEGDAVPAVTWGVDGTGKLFFRRPQAAALAMDEGDASTRVTWTETNAEEYVNSVTLVYATEVQSERLIAWGLTQWTWGQTEPLVVVPLSRTFTSAYAQDEASAIITLPTPIDYMEKFSPVSRVVNFGTMNNAANSDDGDLSTYATMLGNTQVTWADYGVGPVIWRVRLAWYSGFDITIRVTNFLNPNRSTLVYEIKGADNESNGDPIDLWLPSLPLASVEFGGTTTAILSIYAVQNDSSGELPRVHEVEYYVPDCDWNGTASELLAEAFLRPVPSGVAVVESFAFGAVTQTIDLTPLAGSELGLSVERVEYAFTTSEGVVTRYHVGHAYASDLLAQRAVLERLARSATSGVLP